MMRKTAIYALMGAAAMIATAPEVKAAGAYVVGVSAGATGRGSSNYAPIVQSLNLFFNELNAKGGINGHPVKLLVRDNQNNPARSASDAKKFAGNKDILLVMSAALSSTYAPMIATLKKAGLPLMFAGGVCPRAVFPPADRLQFCTTAFAANNDSAWAMKLIKEMATDPVKLGLVAMSIPISRNGIDHAEKVAKGLGMQIVDKENVPPPTPNYAPFATKIKAAGANWGFSWAPWVTQVKTFEALRTQGWKGRYVAYAHINSEDELVRIKDEGFIVFGANAFFQDKLPIHKKIRSLAKKGKASYPVTYLAEGWVSALVLESILKNVSWPPSREKVIASMNQINVDLKGLRGGPMVWTKDNHFRTKMHYRVYRWDASKGAVARIKDWASVDIK